MTNTHDLADNPIIENKPSYYPTETFSTGQVPELKGKQLGDKVTLVVEGKITRVELSEDESRYTIEFRKCALKDDVKSQSGDFVSYLKNTAEQTKKGDFSEDITRVPGQDSKAHQFNQQLSK